MKFIDILKPNKSKKHFEEQISIIYRDLYKFIYSIIKNQNLAEDILQQTLMKAYEKFDTIKDVTKFKSWIFTIAKNESLSWIRKYNREIPSEDTYLELLDQLIKVKYKFEKLVTAFIAQQKDHFQTRTMVKLVTVWI